MNNASETALANPHSAQQKSSAAPKMLACPACGANTPHAFRFTKNSSDIYRCSRCGLGRAESTSFDPDKYYTENYFGGGHVDGYADYRGAEAVLRREFSNTVEFLRRFRASGRLLE